MSHTVTVKLIADQVIEINGKEVNIHDIITIYVDNQGKIIEVALNEGGLSRDYLDQFDIDASYERSRAERR